ncbi:MAG TPA: 30S ribosome-binding factor RbfA [Spirochaetota bacterium]|jgi:ribosome-binding factor A|nr:MAG: Ribosome-binding factor A [Spirochaetes bacterium ADurb.Bin133]HNZ27266.1 30S ribosome-binding factor RbfA [Spirochaetota bacterium]HPY88560.1 30S ribosome-binding factor RbfA [Spirochaetota bacterium]HQB61829.1 30S ribosome-binding factor RbfA [Spirochaetota bacterium]
MKYKMDRAKNLIVQEIMMAITSGAVKDPRAPKIMTITDISLSKDFHYCHLYFTTIGGEEDRKRAVLGLNSARGFFQKLISKNLNMRFTPKIEFRYDEKKEEALRVDNIIENIVKERIEQNATDDTDR